MTETGAEPDDRFRVRPYAITGGRTAAETEFPLETLIRTTPTGTEALDDGLLRFERAVVVEACTTPIAVAEVAARADVYLGIARVLVSDLASEGLVEALPTHKPPSGNRPDVKLLERVLDGLQSL